jgi:subtilisin family serine protease
MLKNLFFLYLIANTLNSFSQSQNREIILKFNYSYLNFDLVDDRGVFSFPVKGILKSRAKEHWIKMEQQYPGISDWQLTKIFPFLTTKDTVSISRLGQKVTIPPFWATFTLNIPENVNLQKIMYELDHLSPLVEYCHYNFPAEFATVPNDTLYPKQVSLNGSSILPNAGINIENAWQIETGKPFIKVGVHDSGIDTAHADLDAVFGGAYFTPNDVLPYTWGEDTYEHGTPVAGIIGAKRNNITGISGIAGGDSTIMGCSLIDLRINFFDQSWATYVCASVVDAARSVGTYWDYPIGYYDETNPYFDGTPGFGVHIGNHSYTIKTNSPVPQDTGVGSGNGDNDDDNDNDDDDDNDDNDDSDDDCNGNKIFVKENNDSVFVSDPICVLCREAYLFSLKNGVINVVSRGNSRQFAPSTDPTLIDFLYPQSFPDNWIVLVGASGHDGLTVQNGLNQSQLEEQLGYWSLYGGNMDLIAPGSDSIIYTTSIVNASTESNPYTKFNGTSAASPHVSGVVALLLSHYNKDCYSNRNLSVEDVEYILERSATNLYGPGYDDTTGWGRLDAYKALQMIENPTKQIIHPDSLISSTVITRDTIALSYRNAFVPDGWGPISSTFPLENNKYYQVERVLVENKYSFANYMLPTTNLIDIWLRPSASNSVELYNDTIAYWAGPAIGYQHNYDEFKMMPFEELTFVDSNLHNVKIRGYYYHFIGRYMDDESFLLDIAYPTNVWLPVNPSNSSKMAFSIYIHDTTLSSQYDFPCDSLNPLFDTNFNLGNNTLDAINLDISLYPNPSNGSFTLINNANQNLFKIEIFDLNGKIIYYSEPNSSKEVIELSKNQKGIYFVKCYDNKGIQILKFIKL